MHVPHLSLSVTISIGVARGVGLVPRLRDAGSRGVAVVSSGFLSRTRRDLLLSLEELLLERAGEVDK